MEYIGIPIPASGSDKESLDLPLGAQGSIGLRANVAPLLANREDMGQTWIVGSSERRKIFPDAKL